jgi:hypothetical protein
VEETKLTGRVTRISVPIELRVCVGARARVRARIKDYFRKF